jgi:hypothetical protein
LFGVYVVPEDGGDMRLRNIDAVIYQKKLKSHTVFQLNSD